MKTPLLTMACNINGLSQQNGKQANKVPQQQSRFRFASQLGGVLIYTSFLTVQLPNLAMPDYYSDRNNSYYATCY